MWKQGASLNIWIAGLYEIKNGKTLCHVIADGKRIATFEPVAPACAWIPQQPKFAGNIGMALIFSPFVGVLSVFVVKSRRRRSLWHRIMSAIMIVAFLFAMMPAQVHAIGTCNPVFYYYLSDNLGSSNIMTDRNGVLVDHFENTAFGKERFNDPSCAFDVSNRYTGQVYDEDTGLYYYNARYYDPELGRFISPDTYVANQYDPQDLNPYSYVSNNPLKYTDSSGHYNSTFGFSNPVLELVVPDPVGAFKSAEKQAYIAVSPESGGLRQAGGFCGTVGYTAQIGVEVSILGHVLEKGIVKLAEKVGVKEIETAAEKGLEKGLANAAEKEAAKGAETSYEIVDGVKRSKAASMTGNKTISANVMDKESSKIIGQKNVSVDSLKSPYDKIDMSNPNTADKFNDTLGKTIEGSTPPPIVVQEGTRGTPIQNVEISRYGN